MGPSTTEHTRTTTKTGWTETSSSSTRHEDPWTTKWVTETVGEPATDPGWTTIVNLPTTTTTITLTGAPTSTEAVPPSWNGASPSGFDFGFVAFVGVITLAVSGLAVGLLRLVHRSRESPGEPVRTVVPVQGDGHGRDDFSQGRDDFHGKA
ncbi:hypothetical protein LA080_015870 [Diaporthe eres]|nr:hypothetical protein LA080_015870 [Diaporthe eres]